MSHKTLIPLLAVAVVCLLAASASATEIIHFTQDFTDNSLADEVGSLNTIDAALGLRAQSAWRTPANSYLGFDKAVTYETGNGFANAKSFRMTMANGGAQVAGRVFVYDTSYISDLAIDSGSIFYSAGPIAVGEWDWATAGDFSFSSSVLTGNRSDVQRTTLANAYTNGADSSGTTDNTLASTLTDAALPGQLANVQRNVVVFQANPAGGANHTRISTAAFNGSTLMGTEGFVDGGAGSYRSDYSGGLFWQMINHASGNVTYASGVTGLTGGSAGGVNVPFNAAENANNLEFGLTKATFKQVWAADFNTDGIVNVSGDGSTLVGNLGGAGKNHFTGDTNGDGVVNVSVDGSTFVGQLGTDLVSSGQGLAEYDPATGIVTISTNGAAFIEVNSAAQFITGNLTAAPPNALVSDPFTASQINYLGFVALGTGGILNDFSLGAILPTGIAGQTVPGANFRWTPLGGGQTLQGPIYIIPEPSSLILAGLASVGMLYWARRRRVVA